jgi:hypothetical protein
MSYKKEATIKAIADNLAFSSKSTTLKNVIGLFDSNRIAQEFFATLFDLIFGYSALEDLDKLNDVVNYPAIDLGDKEAKVAFQITTQSDSDKIKDTISKFIKHNLYKTYNRLIIFIIGEKRGYTTTFDTQGKFKFNKDNDIWDDNYLVKEIDKLDINKLEEINKFLNENLVEIKLPERLFENDIKRCIEILKRDFGTSNEINDSIRRNGEEFAERKNELNNVSWDFFKDKIRGHLQYNQTIEEFLRNPINQKVQEDYFKVTATIQYFYNEKQNNFSTFEEVFREVFNKINTYDDDISGINTKIKIILHNMYFNCDIGNNPSAND